MHEILKLAGGSKPLGSLCKELDDKGSTVYLSEMVGGALSFYAAAAGDRRGGLHIVVAEDRDAAAYAMNDLYALLDEERILFFPSAYKRSILYRNEEAESVVMRTNAVNAVRNGCDGYTVICTYPEALAEKIVDAERMNADSLSVGVGDRIDISDLEEHVRSLGFTQVDFVYEPGQYSVRGGIFDIFSYAESRPYRLDFFDDEVESIRRFEISDQLSSDRLERIDIISNINRAEGDLVSLASFAGTDATWWFYDADYALRRVDDLRRRALKESDEPQQMTRLLASRKELLGDLAQCRLAMLRNNLPERPATATVPFGTSPQPKFNKNFQMLADDVIDRREHGYDCYILTDNRAQVERLDNNFQKIGRPTAELRMKRIELHEGYVDTGLKAS